MVVESDKLLENLGCGPGVPDKVASSVNKEMHRSSLRYHPSCPKPGWVYGATWNCWVWKKLGSRDPFWLHVNIATDYWFPCIPPLCALGRQGQCPADEQGRWQQHTESFWTIACYHLTVRAASDNPLKIRSLNPHQNLSVLWSRRHSLER